MHQSVRDYWTTFNHPLEGRVAYMYLDWKGWLSTGVGNKIDETQREHSPPTPAEREASLRLANRYQWLVNADNSVASPDQVAAEWDTVKSHLELAERGHTAFSPPLTTLHLDEAEIDRGIFEALDQMESYLKGRAEFVDFESWPADAQLAVLSMSWAMGPAFTFPKFQGHVAARRWADAAEECLFNPNVGTIKIRNELDRQCLLKAQAVEKGGLPTESLAMDLSTVFGVQGGLLALGYEPGFQDGADGPATQGAVRAFQNANGLEPTGACDDQALVDALGQRLVERGFQLLTV